MINSFPPGIILVLGALPIPILTGRIRAAYILALPLAALWHLSQLSGGESPAWLFFGYPLEFVRVDGMSRAFGVVFLLAAFLTALYALHVKDTLQQIAGLVYAGAAASALFAGDLITLFIWWEITAISSVFLIWARRTESSYRAGLRYLVIQVGSGVLLLSGTLLMLRDTGSTRFDHMVLGDLPTTLIFLAFGIKAAFPFFHNWLQDAYPEATATGTVVLSAFTTKLAIYALARGFAGTEILVPIGAIMTAFPVFFAVIENDLRRVLAYSLNNQLGFMVVGIGIGTEMSLNGTVSHAFAHILYKALLFMAMGAILLRAGTTKASELGGLYKSMPFSTAFCLIGAASISAFPLFSGFVSKGMIVAAAGDYGSPVIWLALMFASAGVLHHSGIKIPYCGFFGHDTGFRCREAPWNMLAAMGLTALLCVGIGVYPEPLYRLLPYPVTFVPYTTDHVLTQLQLLLFALLAFAVIARRHLEPPELRSINLDTDWVYRRFLPTLTGGTIEVIRTVRAGLAGASLAVLRGLGSFVYRCAGPRGIFARTWPTGMTTLTVAAMLGAFLIFYYL